jgi:hypothetical protein
MKSEVALQSLPDLASHHPSHRHLLDRVPVEGAVRQPIDAVIVPTSRPVSWLREAMHVAGDLGCTLVVLSSKALTAVEVAELGAAEGTSTLAMDVDDSTHPVDAEGTRWLPRTNELLAGTMFERDTDSSVKRNLALLLCRMVGWERVLFLDDDISHVSPEGVEAAAGLIRLRPNDPGYAAVGLRNTGYPDNSVVCHVNREIEGEQDQFIGAGGLAVSPTGTRSFFPDIYNQDWFFLLGDGQPPRVAVTGRMRQKVFDPFADPDRARREELGDCLAEGLYWLLDDRLPLKRAGVEHWRRFLEGRTRFIESLLSKIDQNDRAGQRETRVASLEVALKTREHVTPTLCAEYVRRWHEDLGTWQRLTNDTPTGLDLDAALQHLGLADRARRTQGAVIRSTSRA